MFLSIGMLKQKYFLTDIFILSAEKQPIKLSWRKIEWLLIEAHTDVEQLIRLCEVLVLSGDVFIHVDKKTKDPKFWNRLNLYKKKNNKITIISHRQFVSWGGYSQVECFKSLLTIVLNSTTKYERILLLSGLDYPIYSPQNIQKFFTLNAEKEYVCGYNVTTCPYQMHLHKIRYYHFFRDVPLPHKSIFRKDLIGGSMLLLKYLGFRRKTYLLINGKQWDIYFGSSWIGITRNCAKYILNQLLTNKSLIRYSKNSYAPDELCVPTIVMNSSFADKAIQVDELDFTKATPLHYLNYVNYIWSYNEKDFTTIMSSGKLFVRKIISGKSEKLIEMIKETWK